MKKADQLDIFYKAYHGSPEDNIASICDQFAKARGNFRLLFDESAEVTMDENATAATKNTFVLKQSLVPGNIVYKVDREITKKALETTYATGAAICTGRNIEENTLFRLRP